MHKDTDIKKDTGRYKLGHRNRGRDTVNVKDKLIATYTLSYFI